MTPWLRPLLVLAVLLAVSPVCVSYAVEPSPNETRAGSVPGDGRARPGRDEPAPTSATASVPPYTPPQRPPASTPPATTPPPVAKPPGKATKASDTTRRTATEPAVPALRVLPLGSGLVLIGLGLAFFAVRLRRG